MFSRFWYFVLAAVAAAALASAYLVQAATKRSADQSLDEALRRDRFEVELWMSLDDHARIDAIGPMTTNAEVRAVLTEANARAAGTTLQAGARQRLETTLLQLNRQLAEGEADVLVAIDRHGTIVAQVGGGAPPTDASLLTVDFVASALAGEAKSSIWMRDGAPLRAAARPVSIGGNVVGVIVHAMDIDDDLSRRLMGHVAGASIGFFHGERMIAAASAEGSQTATNRQTMQAALAGARTNADLRATGRTPLLEVGGTAKAIYALFPGQPVDGTLGFVVARPDAPAGTPFRTLASAPSDDIGKLPWALIVLLPIGLALVGLVLTFLERDKPLSAFAAELRRVADGSATKMTSGALKAQFRILAEDVNAGLERAGASANASVRKSQSLDELLGAAPATSVPSYYAAPSANSQAITERKPSVPMPMPPTNAAPRTAPVAPAAPPATPPMSPPAALGPQAPARASIAEMTTLPPSSRTSAASEPVSVPPSAALPSVPVASSALPMAPTDTDEDDDDDGATTVAQIPAELLNALHQDNSEEERHFHEVFEEYVRVREQCGELTKGLTFEKFVVTLRKTKDQIVAKHGSSRVRFTVYIKEGKAALKASPR